ncbi:MAG: chromosome segregation protein SMC [Nitrospirales bacterium]|nr:chromosome segregation protein SMC [Nitrospirales bacterium]
MYLQSLRMTGFKSFPDAILEFPKGITAVVGPNGSGKSNVVDALLWVLGEQSTKTLRSERMEDVIYNGTETQKPLGMAEVSLVVADVSRQELEAVSGLDDEIPHSSELMITRRLYRDGVSEYFINKIPCRLKDIRGVFLEARAGTKGHTVIEQGNLAQILSATPQERRGFIEETAGIGRYKKQKSEALNKLRSTEQNLLRVRDIIGEVQRQLRSLERQVRQAEQYQALRQEARSLEIELLTNDYQLLLTNHTQATQEQNSCEEQEAKHMTEEAALMVRHEEAKASLSEEGTVMNRLQEDLRLIEQHIGQALTSTEVRRNQLLMFQNQRHHTHEEQSLLRKASVDAIQSLANFQNRLSAIDEEITQHTETLAEVETQEHELSAKRAATHEQLEHVRHQTLAGAIDKTNAENQLRNILDQREILTNRLIELQEAQQDYEYQQTQTETQVTVHQENRQHISTTLEHHRQSQKDVQEEIHFLQTSLEEMDKHLMDQQTDQAAAMSRQRALQMVLQEEFGYGRDGEDTVPALRAECQGIVEAIAERLEVPQALEVAIEAVLGDYIHAWVVEEIADGKQAIAFLKEQALGHGTFVPIHCVAVTRGGDPPAWWSTCQGEDGVLGRALDLVRFPDALRPALSCFLDSVVVVQTFENALRLVNKIDRMDAVTFVTVEGEILKSSGIVSGGSQSNTVGLLQRRREIRTLDIQIETTKQTLGKTRQQRDTQCQNLLAAKNRLAKLDQSIKEAEMQWLVVDKETSQLEETLEEIKGHYHTTVSELTASLDTHTQLETAISNAEEQLTTLEQERFAREEELNQLTLALQDIESHYISLQNSVNNARLLLATTHERREHLQHNLTRLTGEEQERQGRLRRFEVTLTELASQIDTNQQEQTQTEAALQIHTQKRDNVHEELHTAEERHAQWLQSTTEFEQALAEIRKAFSAIREQRGHIEIRLAEVRTRIHTVEDTLTETYELNVEDLATQLPTSEAQTADEQPEDERRHRLQDIRQRLERMGAINLVAIEEHQELQARCTFLSKQEEDLSESIRSLQEIIERLNRSTNQMFEDTFHALQEKFNEVFSALFAGGKAELVLVHPDGHENEDWEGEPGVDIVAQPPGKRLKNLSMLSGGEKTLTVLALMFASFLIKPSPFCILDEVDAPLDELNVIRFARFLSQLADQSQFIVITHNKRTMEVADSLFGVTMEEPGISKFISVQLLDLEKV